jgi:hypothetical protein
VMARQVAVGRRRPVGSSQAPPAVQRPRAADSARLSGSSGLLAIAQVGCAAVGGLSIVVALLFEPEFVRIYLSADGVLTAGQAAALPAARLALGIFGAALLLLAGLLPRLAGMPALARLAAGRQGRWLIFLTPPALLLGLLGYKLLKGTGDPFYLLAVREDSLVEWLTALTYFGVFLVAGMLAIRLGLARRYLLAAFFALIGVCGLFVALEEISYGQRLLGFDTPTPVAARNRQDEMTIHNLDLVERLFFTLVPLAVGLFGLLGLALAGMRRWLDRRAVQTLSLLVPPWFLASWFVPVAAFALYATLFWGELALVEWQDQEPLEGLLAFGFLAFVLRTFAQVRNKPLDMRAV